MRKPRKTSGSFRQTSQSGRESTRNSNATDIRHRVAVGMMTFGVIMFLQHYISHFVGYAVISPGIDDLLIGYPTAAVLGIAGMMMLGPEGTPKKSNRR